MIQRTVIALIVALLIVFGLYKWGYGRGWGDRDAEMQAAIAKANEESRAKEQEMAATVQQKEVELRKANDVIGKKESDLNAAIRAGRLRLPATSCVQATTSASPSSGNSTEAGSKPNGTPNAVADGPSEDERKTLEMIAQIAADGDRAINQLNACITAYEDVRRTINANAR